MPLGVQIKPLECNEVVSTPCMTPDWECILVDQITGEKYAPKDAKDYYNVVPRHQAEICYRKALDVLGRCAVAQLALLKCIDGYNRVLQREAPTWFDRHIYDDREPLVKPKRYFEEESKE